MKSGFLTALNRGVVVFDGAMGTSIHSCADCRPEDYLGRENCTDILVKSRPDLIQRIHEGFLAAGADVVSAVELIKKTMQGRRRSNPVQTMAARVQQLRTEPERLKVLVRDLQAMESQFQDCASKVKALAGGAQ
jgi:methionine synthase I (cobalamin-dependent)